ncbi:MAG: D-amino acid dehydrogenase [Pelagibacterales bacterium]|nr:D-amino acid dehydrogenase [Pelagibacterales bacterium]PPR16282.1 MAG: D-amino acid dehydrogenase 1 [Alphaproteobacteria bacterium MarineAlpha9_Bin3]|tara:strand:+ start:22818 stop:23969 length:1152 start_codon:yes stop_codon:yes gene_type:complete
MRIKIIGSGITGITTAYYLAKNKHQVTILDERRYPAMATSYANGCQISASNSETWNSWKNIRQALKWLSKKEAPLLISLKPELNKYHWFIKFINSIPEKEINTLETCKMALNSINLYKIIAKEENIKFDMIEKGILHIYKKKSELELARKINKIYKSAGLERWEVNKNEIMNIEPSLSDSNIMGGFYNTTDFTGDIHKFCIELSYILENKYEVIFMKHHANNLIEELNNTDIIIVCAGIGSRKLANSIGDTLPIYPVKGYSITINNPGNNSPWVSLLDDEKKIVTARLGEKRLRIAGTAEFSGYNTDIKWDRVRPLIRWAETNFPNINTEDIKPWAGLRPMTPNMMPIVQQSKKNRKIFYNTGHGHLGWTLSAFTAKKISQLI